jgi:amidase
LPIAHASDGGGSIRIPASFTGLFGLKPSRGRVSEGPGNGEVWQGCVVSHALTRSVRDSAALLDAIAGPMAGDPFVIAPPSRPYVQEVGAPPGRLRIGFSVASPISGRVDAGNREAVVAAGKLLESLGHHVEQAAPAIDGKLLARCYMHLYFGTVAAMLARIRRDKGVAERVFHPDTRAIAMIGRAISAGEFAASLDEWNGFARSMGDFFARYDLYMTPTVAMQPARIGELETPRAMQTATKLLAALDAGKLLLKTGIVDKLSFENLERTPFTQLGNMTFGPGMSVPLHWDASGLPVGVMFGARFGAEDVLFRLASQLEEAVPWAGKRPAP